MYGHFLSSLTARKLSVKNAKQHRETNTSQTLLTKIFIEHVPINQLINNLNSNMFQSQDISHQNTLDFASVSYHCILLLDALRDSLNHYFIVEWIVWCWWHTNYIFIKLCHAVSLNCIISFWQIHISEIYSIFPGFHNFCIFNSLRIKNEIHIVFFSLDCKVAYIGLFLTGLALIISVSFNILLYSMRRRDQKVRGMQQSRRNNQDQI